MISDMETEPAWQTIALSTTADHGIELTDSETVSRSQTAIALYQESSLAQPGEETRQ